MPYDPSKEPALQGEDELRKGAASLRSGQSPFPDTVKQVGPGLYQLDTISLDLNARRVIVPGRINMTAGIIEYLAVMDRRGKLHESVLALDVQPSLLQLALILLGLEPGELTPWDPVTRRPPTLAKWGDPVALWVEWDRNGRTERVPAESLIFNRETQRALEGNRWHFTGSFFGRNRAGQSRFAADVTGSIIATWKDLRAMVNASAQAGNPYQGAQRGYEVNSRVVPALDTPIRLIFDSADRGPKKVP